MRTAQQWLNEYGKTHRNKVNERLHLICVPLIYWSVLAIFWIMPQPAWMLTRPYLNWTGVEIFLLSLFYLRLGVWPFMGVSILNLVGIALIVGVERSGLPLAVVAIAAFALAWIGQFVGHGFEGKRPSFTEDLRFLLIGPLWTADRIRRLLVGEPFKKIRIARGELSNLCGSSGESMKLDPASV